MPARDRLAAARAQRAQMVHPTVQPTSQIPSPPPQIPSPPPQDLSPPSRIPSPEPTYTREQPVNDGRQLTTTSFLEQASSIQDGIKLLDERIAQISQVNRHRFNETDAEAQASNAELDNLINRTRDLAQDLKNKIQYLQVGTATGDDAQMRQNRISFIRVKFSEALQNYQHIAQEGRSRLRDRVERQVRIVKADATPEEIKMIVDGGGDQIFAQAMLSSTRYAESKAIYGEVRIRQQELQRMESTLAELTQLFSDMAAMVEQQDQAITTTENTAREVEEDTRKGLEYTIEAVFHARRYRRARWICCGLVVICCLVLAIVLGVVFGTRAKK
ncbi:t-SNARE [Crucibulum laeve]|uniref:t-SNARE n=1 Tax=Crucibulum laeve TaxID=68775 RepID=A0A5C3MBG9_9AGAR|nr:t-SNARE [Crucibulum laeve]